LATSRSMVRVGDSPALPSARNACLALGTAASARVRFRHLIGWATT
jgi:hypothetical protein